MGKLLIINQKIKFLNCNSKILLRFRNNFCTVFENKNTLISKQPNLKLEKFNYISILYKNISLKHKFRNNLYINKIVTKDSLKLFNLNFFLTQTKIKKYCFTGAISLNNGVIFFDKKKFKFLKKKYLKNILNEKDKELEEEVNEDFKI